MPAFVDLTSTCEDTPAGFDLLDQHSLLNLFNVLNDLLGGLSLPDPRLEHYRGFIADAVVRVTLTSVKDEFSAIEHEIEELSNLIGELRVQHPLQLVALQNILESLEVALTRLGEFRQDRFQWQEIPRDELEEKLYCFLKTTEKVSLGRFSFAFPPAPSPVDGYRLRLEVTPPGQTLFAPPIIHDVIRDLVGNARKYSDPATEIRVALDSVPVRSLRLTVTDTGIGVPPDEVRRITHYGYRATNARSRRTMGDGFGLTKVCHLARELGGSLRIATAEGAGTTIAFELPRAGQAGRAFARRAQATSPPGG